MEKVALKVNSHLQPQVVRVRKTDRAAINDQVWEVLEVIAEVPEHPFAPNLLKHEHLFGERLGTADSGMGNHLLEIHDLDAVLKLIEDGDRKWQEFVAQLPEEVEVRCWECGRVVGRKKISTKSLLDVYRFYGIPLEEQLKPLVYCGC